MMGLPWGSSDYKSTIQCRGHRCNPWLGNKDPTCREALTLEQQLRTPHALEPTSHSWREVQPQQQEISRATAKSLCPAAKTQRS